MSTAQYALAPFRFLLIATLLIAFPSWGVTSQIATDHGSQVKLAGGDGNLPSAAGESPDNSQDDDAYCPLNTEPGCYASLCDAPRPPSDNQVTHLDSITPPPRAPPGKTVSYTLT